MTSYLILGAGNFGAATARSLVMRGETNVKLVDTARYPNPRAASHDINKIVRNDYPEPAYMRMLVKTMPKWRSDPLFSPFYHEVGMLRADKSSFGPDSIAQFERLGIDHHSEMLPVEEVRKRWNGAFATADLGDLTHVLWNPDVGFAEADKALGAIVQDAVDRGVEYVLGEAVRLSFAPDGACNGVQLRCGETLTADKILVCTGARTAALLASSAPSNKALHVGDRVVATGAVSFYAKLEGAQREKFAPIPVFKNCLPNVKGEGMSILKDGTIKFNCDMCFTNMVDFAPTREQMSLVPEQSDYNVWTGPKFIKYFEDRARRTLDGLYGKEVENVSIEAYRMCWDASTPTHDFLITPHPHCANLYIATGGSFHGWKFLPVIGDYVADMLNGTLDPEYAEMWAWDRPIEGGDRSANPTYQILGDLKDLVKEG